ncbi:copper resistance CopC family protein [Couchioplanes azureus]|uniref:copper resistance CopC family protein n=1 Tax=Couchioplanes caeruleus TaxID=56438 RepID=UPI0016709564|nr:copper resistance CopC family protein [Couchioplanes caeruleus]GGQ73626.1 hypothetical protein GCM10010166_49680 [Couchioplanes caeruleus subsp. azureus]
MDHSDRIRSLRRTARLRRGRLDRRPAARLTALLLAVAAAALTVLLPGGPAWAHNALAEAVPAKNAVLKKAPGTVKLRFLQKLNPDLTTVTVSDAGKKPVPVSPPKVDGATVSVTLPVPPANGKYTVAYRVVSQDGHTVQGSYDFTVKDPSAAAPAASAPATLPSAAAASAVATGSPAPGTPPAQPEKTASSTLSGGAVAGIIAAVLVVAAATGFLVRRRRAR